MKTFTKKLPVILIIASLCNCKEQTKPVTISPGGDSAESTSGLSKFFPGEAANKKVEENIETTTENQELATEVTLTGLEIFPKSFNLAVGSSKALRATAIYSDGSKKIVSEECLWATSDRSSAGFQDASKKEVVIAIKAGGVKVSCSFDKTTAYADIVIKDKSIVSLEIDPKTILLGDDSGFRAFAVFNDSSTQEITQDVIWGSGDTTMAQVIASDGGRVSIRGIRSGLVSISATYKGFSGQGPVQIIMPSIQKITVQSDTEILLLATSVPLKAMATFASGKEFDISTSVTWLSNNQSVAAFSLEDDFSNYLSTMASGEVQVSATYGDVIGTKTLQVGASDYLTYSIEPDNADVAINFPKTFKAYGHLSNGDKEDISAQVIWTLDNPYVASVSNDIAKPGIVIGMSKGDAILAAKFGSKIFTTAIHVTGAALKEIVVDSANPLGPCGVNEPLFTAKGIYSDNSEQDITKDVTWSVANPLFASVSNVTETKGKVSTYIKGSVKIYATFFDPFAQKNIVGEASSTATDPVFTGYRVTSAKASIPIGHKVQFDAYEHFSCEIANPKKVTSQVTWSSDNSEILAFDGNGLATSSGDIAEQVTVKVEASKTINSVVYKGSFDLPIRAKEVDSLILKVTSGALFVEVEGSEQIDAEATYTNGTKGLVTNPADAGLIGYTMTWTVVAGYEAKGILNDSDQKGLLTGAQEGLIQISGKLVTPTTTKQAYLYLNIQSKCINGTRFSFWCWYLGNYNESCDELCARKNSDHVEGGTLNYAMDTQSGINSGASCDGIFGALGLIGLSADNKTHSGGQGLGCSLFYNPSLGISTTRRYTSPIVTSGAKDTNFKRVCSCSK